jgi:hypothetical protein
MDARPRINRTEIVGKELSISSRWEQIRKIIEPDHNIDLPNLSYSY